MRINFKIWVFILAAILFTDLRIHAQNISVTNQNPILLKEISKAILRGDIKGAEALISNIIFIDPGEKVEGDRAKEIEIRKKVLNYLVHLHFYQNNPNTDAGDLSLEEIAQKFGQSSNCPPQEASSTSNNEIIRPSVEELTKLLAFQYQDLSVIRAEWKLSDFQKLESKSIDELLDNSELWKRDYFKIALGLHSEDLKIKISQRLNTVESIISKLASNHLEDIFTKTLLDSALRFRRDLMEGNPPDFNYINLSDVVKDEYKILLPGIESLGSLDSGQKIKNSYRTIPYPKITNTKAKPAGHFFYLFNEIAKKERNIDLLDFKNINLESFNFVTIEPGIFKMGSKNHFDTPVHEVELTEETTIQATTVTQLQWYIVTGETPSGFKEEKYCPKTWDKNLKICPNNPVEHFSKDQLTDFIKKLNDKAKELGYKESFELPTEAQYYYANKGGSTTQFYWGDNIEEISKYAWTKENSSNQTHEVGKLLPNAYGLYDMNGNVWQCMRGYYHRTYGLNSEELNRRVVNPTGPSSGTRPTLSGGSWDYDTIRCDPADRGFNWYGYGDSSLGLRFIRTKK